MTDPKPGITGCINHALARLGHKPHDPTALEWCIGPPLGDSLATLMATDEPSAVAAALTAYRERFSTLGMFENAVYEGIPECLNALRQAGFRLFVATSKPHVFARRIVEHFGLAKYFEEIYGSELDGERADKGELIRHLLAAENLNPLRTFMVGDREHDALGAAKNGISTVGVLYGYGSREELAAAGADPLCETPRTLTEALIARAGRA